MIEHGVSVVTNALNQLARARELRTAKSITQLLPQNSPHERYFKIEVDTERYTRRNTEHMVTMMTMYDMARGFMFIPQGEVTHLWYYFNADTGAEKVVKRTIHQGCSGDQPVDVYLGIHSGRIHGVSYSSDIRIDDLTDLIRSLTARAQELEVSGTWFPMNVTNGNKEDHYDLIARGTREVLYTNTQLPLPEC